MTIFTEGAWRGEFLISEGPRTFSRGSRTQDSSVTTKPGTVLGIKTLGAATVVKTAKVGNIGDGAITAITSTAGAPAGTYVVKFDATGATAAFTVYKPDGTIDGVGKVGTAYVGSINFTPADDAGAHYTAEDEVYFAVSYAAGTERVVPWNPAATDGSQLAAAIAYDGGVTAGGAALQITTIERQAEVDAALLDWGADSAESALGTAQLAALNPPIIVR